MPKQQMCRAATSINPNTEELEMNLSFLFVFLLKERSSQCAYINKKMELLSALVARKRS